MLLPPGFGLALSLLAAALPTSAFVDALLPTPALARVPQISQARVVALPAKLPVHGAARSALMGVPFYVLCCLQLGGLWLTTRVPRPTT